MRIKNLDIWFGLNTFYKKELHHESFELWLLLPMKNGIHMNSILWKLDFRIRYMISAFLIQQYHKLSYRISVPKVLVHCAEFIEERGIVDGIYRLGGVASNIQRLR